MRKRFKKILYWLLAAVLTWIIVLGIVVWQYGSHDQATKSDCIIVLGAAVDGKSASPVFAERIRHGINLYNNGYAPKIIFTGGVGDRGEPSEGAVGRSLALDSGIPATDILIEETSRTTQENLSEARSLMRQHGMKSGIIVSDPLHMKRAIRIAEGLELTAVSSPTPTSRYRSFNTQLGFLLRELYFIHHNMVTGQ